MPLDDVSGLSTSERRAIIERRAEWVSQARPRQIPPVSQHHSNWMVKAGRGFGKTRIGAEETWWAAYRNPGIIQHVIAPTRDDLRFYCFDGKSGILNTIPAVLLDKNAYNKTDITLRLRNGSFIRGFSADVPDRLRGPQCHRRWNDELAAWADGRPSATWNMAEFGTRLPRDARWDTASSFRNLITTTPRPIPLIRQLARDPATIVVSGSTYENKDNLDPEFFAAITKFEGTALGDQEIYGEILEDDLNGIIHSDWLMIWPRAQKLPDFEWITVSFDTAFTERTTHKDNRPEDPGADPNRKTPDPTACSVWGAFRIKNRPQFMLLDCWQDYMGFPELVRAAQDEMKIEWGAEVPEIKGQSSVTPGTGRRPDIMIIEEKGSGISLRQAMEAENIFPYRYNPGKADKLQRLHLVSHIFKGGFIWVPEGKDRYGQPNGKPRKFAEPLIEQICTFAGDGSIPHDDLMDTATQAVRYFADNYNISVTLPEKRGNPEDEPVRRRRENYYAA